jgi:hypothetical protein
MTYSPSKMAADMGQIRLPLFHDRIDHYKYLVGVCENVAVILGDKVRYPHLNTVIRGAPTICINKRVSPFDIMVSGSMLANNIYKPDVLHDYVGATVFQQTACMEMILSAQRSRDGEHVLRDMHSACSGTHIKVEDYVELVVINALCRKKFLHDAAHTMGGWSPWLQYYMPKDPQAYIKMVLDDLEESSYYRDLTEETRSVVRVAAVAAAYFFDSDAADAVCFDPQIKVWVNGHRKNASLCMDRSKSTKSLIEAVLGISSDSVKNLSHHLCDLPPAPMLLGFYKPFNPTEDGEQPNAANGQADSDEGEGDQGHNEEGKEVELSDKNIDFADGERISVRPKYKDHESGVVTTGYRINFSDRSEEPLKPMTTVRKDIELYGNKMARVLGSILTTVFRPPMPESGHKSGDIDPNALADYAVGSQELFTQPPEEAEFTTYVGILIDMSGSMATSIDCPDAPAGWDRMASSICVAMALIQSFGFKTKVGVYCHDAYDNYKHDKDIMSVNVIKFSPDNILNAYGPRAENADGYAIKHVGELIMAEKASRRVMINISDGLPSVGNKYSGRKADSHVRRCVEEVRRMGVHFLCIGLDDCIDDHRAIRMYGHNFINSPANPDQLGPKVARSIASMLR